MTSSLPITLSPPRRRRDRSRMTLTVVTLIVVCVALVGFAFGPEYWNYWRYEPQEGDVIFQSLPHSPLANAIEGATHSPWSHCGIVARDRDRGWIVYEAYDGVSATPLAEFLFRSRNARYAIYRLRGDHRRHIPQTLVEVRQFLGRPYDSRYRMDDENIYCSELVYKAYGAASGERLGELVRLGDLDWREYVPLIEHLEGGPVPVDREMITPRDMALAKQLELVRESGG